MAAAAAGRAGDGEAAAAAAGDGAGEADGDPAGRTVGGETEAAGWIAGLAVAAVGPPVAGAVAGAGV
jgi:hypothetical protein